MDYYISSKVVRVQFNKLILLLNSNPDIKLTGDYLMQILANMTSNEVFIQNDENKASSKLEYEEKITEINNTGENNG